MTVKERLHRWVEEMPESEAKDLLRSLDARANGAPSEPRPKTVEEVIEGVVSQIPEEKKRKVPADLLDQLDHYVYGTPKR